MRGAHSRSCTTFPSVAASRRSRTSSCTIRCRCSGWVASLRFVSWSRSCAVRCGFERLIVGIPRVESIRFNSKDYVEQKPNLVEGDQTYPRLSDPKGVAETRIEHPRRHSRGSTFVDHTEHPAIGKVLDAFDEDELSVQGMPAIPNLGSVAHTGRMGSRWRAGGRSGWSCSGSSASHGPW